MSQHTKGLWQVIEGNQIRVVSANGSDVAQAATTQDARLIAAAPELLEALTHCESVIADFAEHRGVEMCAFAEALEAARAALAKASGEGRIR